MGIKRKGSSRKIEWLWKKVDKSKMLKRQHGWVSVRVERIIWGFKERES